ITDQPSPPCITVGERHGTRLVRYWPGWIGNIFIVLCSGSCGWSRKRKAGIRCQIKRTPLRGTTGIASLWPRFETVPMIFAGVVNQDRRRVSPRRIFLQILIKEWFQDIPADFQSRITVPPQRAKRRSFAIDLTVKPWSHD